MIAQQDRMAAGSGRLVQSLMAEVFDSKFPQDLI